jgi:hypothetical protein
MGSSGWHVNLEQEDPPRTLSSLDVQSNGLHGLACVSGSGLLLKERGDWQGWVLTCRPQTDMFEVVEPFLRSFKTCNYLFLR